MNQDECLSRFDEIVKSFSAKDRMALMHDLDADGISSGAITYNAIKLLRGKAPDIVVTQAHKTIEVLPKSISLLKKKKINVFVSIDSALDQNVEALEKVEKVVDKILIIDHHKDYAPKGIKKTFIIKPQFVSEIEPSRYPSAKFAFDLFSRHLDMQRYSWVVCIGLMGDNQLSQWKEFVEKSAAEHGTTVDEIWKATEIITAVETLAPAKLQKLLLLLANSVHPIEIINSEFAKYLDKLNSMLDKLMAEFKKKRVVYDTQELVWFEFKARAGIKSALINKVSNTFFPNRTVIFVQDSGDKFLHFSARRQDFKVKMNELLENAVKGFKDAGAGGHIPASAGRIRKRDLKEFKKRIIAALSA